MSYNLRRKLYNLPGFNLGVENDPRWRIHVERMKLLKYQHHPVGCFPLKEHDSVYQRLFDQEAISRKDKSVVLQNVMMDQSNPHRFRAYFEDAIMTFESKEWIIKSAKKEIENAWKEFYENHPIND